jgi:hypothetical protein
VDGAIVKNKCGTPLDVAFNVIVNPIQRIGVDVNINPRNNIIPVNFFITGKIWLGRNHSRKNGKSYR